MIISSFSELDPDNREILRLLGRKTASKPIKSEYLDLIDTLKSSSANLIEPKGIYETFQAEELPNRPCFNEALQIALAICTIGEKLPNKVSSLIKSGDLVQAVIMDAIGSVTVEKVADAINNAINDQAEILALEYGKRYSPGYCGWPTQDQAIIFSNIAGESIGVNLTSSFMMKPIKSVSFAVNFYNTISLTGWEYRCKVCEQKGECSYRFS